MHRHSRGHGSQEHHRQHELEFRSWGGARRGAGRKPSGPRARVSHSARPRHAAGHPLHVTVRLRAGLPSLREKAARDRILAAFAAGRERFGFRLTQYSLQSNHLHLIAEAGDRRALSRGMQGLLVRIARALNELWKHVGSVFSDRFHARELRTPREVRAALVYVLQNARHHGLALRGVDPCSSGPWFDGWKERIAKERITEDRFAEQRLAIAVVDPAAEARTWLLREG